jgi:hypothetical protein
MRLEMLNAGGLVCKNHRNAVEWFCESCNIGYCSSCVSAGPYGLAELPCPDCGVMCVQPRGARKVDHSFFGRLLDAFAYPVRGRGFIMMAAGAVFFFFFGLGLQVSFNVFFMILFVLFWGYLAACLFNMIQSTANGEDDIPDWPSLGDIYNDMARPFFLVSSTLLAMALPAAIYAFWIAAGPIWPDPVFWGLIIAGLFMFPMALLAVVLFNTPMAVSPHVILPAIFRTFGHYLIAFLMLAILSAVGIVVYAYLEQIIPVIGWLFGWPLFLYLLAVEMRILGLLYHANRRKLGWFEVV